MAKEKKFLITAIFVITMILARGIFNARATSGTMLYLSPDSGVESVGQSFTVNIDVSSPDQAMNAAQGVISFPSDKLDVVSISKASSIVTLWVQDPSFSNKDGVINFQGVVVNPGFLGNIGKILTVTFRVKAIGDAPIAFTSGSILANDGKGTNIISGLGNADFILKAPLPSIATSSSSTPEATTTTAVKGEDTNSPEPFLITRRDSDLTDTQPILTWSTTDDGSGISHYEMKIGDGDWFIPSTAGASSHYILPVQSPTTGRTIIVRAYDNAGNYRDSSLTFVVVPKTGWHAWVYYGSQLFSVWKWVIWGIIAILFLGAYLLIYILMRWKKDFQAEMGNMIELRQDLKRLREKLDNVEKEDKERRREFKKETERIKEDIDDDLKKIKRL